MLNWQAWMYPKPSSSWQGLPRYFFYGPRLHLHISCFILCRESQCIQQNCCGLDNVTSASQISTAICFFSSHFGLSLSSSKATNDVASFWYLDQIENLLQAPVWCHCLGLRFFDPFKITQVFVGKFVAFVSGCQL